MFGNKGFRVAGGSLQVWQGISIANVSQGNANISQDTPTFRSQHWSAGKSGFETGGIKAEQVEQVRLAQIGTAMRTH